MKQIRSATRQRFHSANNETKLEVSQGAGVFGTAIVALAFVGALEGLIAYALLNALNNAEVWNVSPRPLFMVSAGVAWRFLRGIDRSMQL
jgi:hypothetical protein